MGFLAGKRLLITGLLSNRSIAYGIARSCRTQGAELAFTYQNDRFRDRVTEMAAEFGSNIVLPCDVAQDAQIEALFESLRGHWDGLDGLVGGCMAIAIAAVASQLSDPSPTWGLVGALLGFLLWNWSPAKVFMGDVGSTFLGAVFVGLVLQASTWPETLGLLLILTPLLGDASLCVLRRLMAGQRIFQAHRLHLFQRLHQSGCSHASVASLYIAATAAVALALLLGGLLWAFAISVLEVVVGIWLDQRVAVPFVAAS